MADPPAAKDIVGDQVAHTAYVSDCDESFASTKGMAGD